MSENQERNMNNELPEDDGLDLDGIQHLMNQAVNGEFAMLDDEARTMNVNEFARKYGKMIRPWGHPPNYQCVLIDRIEYLWRIKDGEYDGWNMAVGYSVDDEGNVTGLDADDTDH